MEGSPSIRGGGMYRMCAGPAAAGTGPVWHVVSGNDTPTTRCGQPVPAPTEELTTERYCGPCMEAVEDLMHAGAA